MYQITKTIVVIYPVLSKGDENRYYSSRVGLTTEVCTFTFISRSSIEKREKKDCGGICV